jgi:hypothetical protein
MIVLAAAAGAPKNTASDAQRQIGIKKQELRIGPRLAELCFAMQSGKMLSKKNESKAHRT